MQSFCWLLLKFYFGFPHIAFFASLLLLLLVKSQRWYDILREIFFFNPCYGLFLFSLFSASLISRLSDKLCLLFSPFDFLVRLCFSTTIRTRYFFWAFTNGNCCCCLRLFGFLHSVFFLFSLRHRRGCAYTFRMYVCAIWYEWKRDFCSKKSVFACPQQVACVIPYYYCVQIESLNTTLYVTVRFFT